MSKHVVGSAKFSSLEVVNDAKFDGDLTFDDLNMSGNSMVINVTEDLVINSTGEASPNGVQVVSVGDVLTMSSAGTNSVLSGTYNGVGDGEDGEVILGYMDNDAEAVVPVVHAVYTLGTDASSLGFLGATPVVQVTDAIAASAFVANTSGISDDTATFGGYTIGQVVAALQAYGLLA